MSETQGTGHSLRHPVARAGFGHEGAACWQPAATDHIAEAIDEFENRIRVRVVNDAGRRTRASSLLQRRYAWRGYSSSPLEDHGSGRLTLAACVDEATIATMTASLDSADGLYVGKLYADEVQALRDQGRRLCDFTKLAVDESVRSHSVLASLFHVACIYVFSVHRCTDVLIEVNPRHVRFYQRMLGFKLAAEQRMDPEVGAPAVLLRLDGTHCLKEIARLGGRRNLGQSERSFYPHFFGADEAAKVVSRLQGH